MSENSLAVKPLLPAWRIAAVWALLSMVGVALAMPFLLSLLEGLDAPNRPPTPVLALVSMVQTGFLAFFLAWGGTAAGRKLGIGSPFVEAWLSGQRPPIPKTFGVAASLGAISALVVIGLDVAFAPHMPAPLRGALPQPTPFQGFLASFYGGIAEEVLMRLGAASIAAWAMAKVVGFEGQGRKVALAIGVVFAALLFGAGHLPMGFTLWPPTVVVVARILVLNAIVGLLAGIVYVRRGMEHAVVLHFTADIMLYVITPLVRGWMGA
jgi:membrane protease YdiL (CAAX protease family)